MLDQNTTTVLTTAITVLGTLGGAIVGVVLTNRHNTKLETLKIEHEKLKRRTEAIEEVYSLLLKFLDRVRINLMLEKNVEDETTDEFRRVRTLVHLYLPSIVPLLNSFSGQYVKCWFLRTLRAKL